MLDPCWSSLDDLDDQCAVLRSCGWLITQTDSCYVFSSDFDSHGEVVEYNRVSIMPKGCIISMLEIEGHSYERK